MSIDSGYKELDYCVHSVMSDLQETSTVNYPRYLKWAIDCYQELNLYLSPVIKTVELQIEDNMTIPFPDDYISYTAIGVNVNNKIWTLTQRSDMVLDRREDCPISLAQAAAMSQQQTQSQVLAIVPYRYFFGGSYRGGQYVAEQFAYGGGWNYKGYFREDTEFKRFQFASTVPKTTIILEYKASGISCDGTVQVKREAIPAIVAYIHWHRIEHNNRVPMAEKERKRRLYIVEYEKLKHYTLSFTVSEFMDAKNKTIRSTPKR